MKAREEIKINDRKVVVVNQAVNYLTIAMCNEFYNKFSQVALITGNVHSQGELLDKNIEISYINKWKEEHGFGKLIIYLKALWKIYFLLMTKYRHHEVFFVSVPPMGYLLNIVLPHRFSMLIWDVYPDVLKITGLTEKHPVYRIWSVFNKKSFKKSYRLLTIGDKMADLLARYVDREKLIVQPIWSIFQENKRVVKSENPFIKTHNLTGKFIIQYSGNIGLTHKVEVMIDLAERMVDHPDIVFQIIGRGPRKKKLEELVEQKQLSNCTFLPFQSDDMFPFSLSAADVGMVILDEKTSNGSVPSKSYNLMSLGIPSLYIASRESELNNYAEKFGHARCFSENELDEAVKYILKLFKEQSYYTQVSENSVKASANFKRENAAKIVDFYLKDS